MSLGFKAFTVRYVCELFASAPNFSYIYLLIFFIIPYGFFRIHLHNLLMKYFKSDYSFDKNALKTNKSNFQMSFLSLNARKDLFIKIMFKVLKFETKNIINL